MCLSATIALRDGSCDWDAEAVCRDLIPHDLGDESCD